ncbi:MAG: hypothetical protein KJ621_03475 [Proteobacteria bacterium]|nr:hypothetical protein [Pseudomonadota bacterium]MBU1742493.1 hypothetical protein [Pseudomonadota bacterium]
MREQMKKQTGLMTDQKRLAHAPYVMAWMNEKYQVHLVNVGNGPAINLTFELGRYNEKSEKYSPFEKRLRWKIVTGQRVAFYLAQVEIIPYLQHLPPALIDEKQYDGSLHVTFEESNKDETMESPLA